MSPGSRRIRAAGFVLASFLVSLATARTVFVGDGRIRVDVPDGWESLGGDPDTLGFSIPPLPGWQGDAGGTVLIRSTRIDPVGPGATCAVRQTPPIHAVEVETRTYRRVRVTTWRAASVTWESMALAERAGDLCIRFLAAYSVPEQEAGQENHIRAGDVMEAIRSTTFDGESLFE